MAAKLEISIFALWAVSTSFINQLSRRLTGAIRFGTGQRGANMKPKIRKLLLMLIIKQMKLNRNRLLIHQEE